MNLVEGRGLSMAFGARQVFSGLNFAIAKGQTVSILGPSGCGKSTLLGLAAGILIPTGGEILFSGVKIGAPSRRRVLIFQNHSLFPWLTALGNIEFALEAQGLSRGERSLKAREKLAQVGLTEFAGYYPHELSGGMQQRTGIARALAVEPELLLLDEPFASLDFMNRDNLLQDFKFLKQTLNMTCMLVTHDIEEAIFSSDRIYLMTEGGLGPAIEVSFPKPDRLIDLKQRPEFLRLEREIHENLFASG